MRIVALLAVAMAAILAPATGQELDRPFRVGSSGTPIAVDQGHAAPLLFDIDGDGKRDLLVGQYGGGRLRVYLNGGSDSIPQFVEYHYLAAGDSLARVPGG